MLWEFFFQLIVLISIKTQIQVQGVLTHNSNVTVKEIREELNSVVAFYELKLLNESVNLRHLEGVEIFVLRERNNYSGASSYSIQFKNNSSLTTVGMHKAPVIGHWVQLSFRLNEEFKEVLKQHSNACDLELQRLTALLVLDERETKIPCRYLHDNKKEFCFPTSYNGVFRVAFKDDVFALSRIPGDEVNDLLNDTCFQTPDLFGFIVVGVLFLLIIISIGAPEIYKILKKIRNCKRSKEVSPF